MTFCSPVVDLKNLFLDGVDGKQARRTQTSGPLGELFDHGLDSFTAALIPAAMYSIFGRGSHSISPLRMYYILWNIFINFYLSHFEKYNTGVLFLPWGYDCSMWVSIDCNITKLLQVRNERQYFTASLVLLFIVLFVINLMAAINVTECTLFILSQNKYENVKGT